MTDDAIFKIELLCFLAGYAAGSKDTELTEEARAACHRHFTHIRYSSDSIDKTFNQLRDKQHSKTTANIDGQ